MLQAIGVSDVKMEEGSMRVDANVSVRPVGTEELGTKVEIKNMNSLRSLGRAIDYEIARQIEMRRSAASAIVQETRDWDEAAGVSQGMRSKEGSNDYRYFPEPDLVPVAPSDEMRADGARHDARAAGRRAGRGSSPSGGSRTRTRGCSSTTRCSPTTPTRRSPLGAPGKDVANWCTGEILGYLNETGLSPAVLPLPPDGSPS